MEQLKLFDQLTEASLYHDDQKGGFFAILTGDGRSKKQRSYRVADMHNVIPLIDTSINSWISQAEFFKANRRVVSLLRLNLNFVDFDTYHCEWAKGRSPEQQAQTVLYECEQQGIPYPSLIIHSGRGLYGKWFYQDSLPRRALPRWNAVQRYLVEKLEFIGADPAAKDASRVLRLCNSVNTRSGEIVRVVHVTEQNGEPIKYDFNYLAECILPFSREYLEEKRKEREQKPLKIIKGGYSGNLTPFSGRQLAWDRLEDLRSLVDMRGGQLGEGSRMLFLHWQLNFLLLSGATNSNQMYREAASLASVINNSWGYHSKELSTLYRKAKALESGEKVVFEGKSYPPLYTPKNDHLINLFKITSEEQEKLKTIIDKDMVHERRKKRQREHVKTKRRDSGVIPRSEYLTKAEENKEKAMTLKEKGLSIRKIATELGVSKSQIQRYFQGVPCPSPITNGGAPLK
jgi:hypothetical protein